MLVGAVGVIPKRSWRDTDEATWAHTIDVNLSSAFRWTAAACRRWIDDPVDGQAPAIVHVVSVEATVAFPQQVAYAASKAGLAGLIRAMAVDLADAGIRICGVAPGTVPNLRAGPASQLGLVHGAHPVAPPRPPGRRRRRRRLPGVGGRRLRHRRDPLRRRRVRGRMNERRAGAARRRRSPRHVRDG